MEFPADFANWNSILGRAGRDEEPFDRLPQRLIAQLESTVVHWNHKLRPDVVGHCKGLLGIAVCSYPRVVSAYGHDRQVHLLRGADLAEQIRKSRVASENDAAPSGFDQISVVSAMNIGVRAGAPVLDFECSNRGGTYLA